MHTFLIVNYNKKSSVTFTDDACKSKGLLGLKRKGTRWNNASKARCVKLQVLKHVAAIIHAYILGEAVDDHQGYFNYIL